MAPEGSKCPLAYPGEIGGTIFECRTLGNYAMVEPFSLLRSDRPHDLSPPALIV